MLDTLDHEFSHKDVIIDGKPFSAKLCNTWVTDMLWAQFWNQTVSIITVILNYFLREIIIMMIFKIGFHTETSQTNIIMIFVFAVQFFNTAILITLINANTNEAGLHLGIFNGIYPDFNYNWYSDIGATIIYTMSFNALWPFIEIALRCGPCGNKQFAHRQQLRHRLRVDALAGVHAGDDAAGVGVGFIIFTAQMV